MEEKYGLPFCSWVLLCSRKSYMSIFFLFFLPYLQDHGLLRSRNYATLATWRNDFPSLLQPRNRRIRLTQCCTQFKPFGNKTFCFRNFHTFKWECHIIMQIQYTKNLNPGRFELGTTLSCTNWSINPWCNLLMSVCISTSLLHSSTALLVLVIIIRSFYRIIWPTKRKNK